MSNQQTRTTARLREMVLNGAFAPGERITESALATALGVSRTPVRVALSVLEREGLVSSEPNRGFRVEAYSIGDISDAIDVRGTLEGMAARLVAEGGLDEEIIRTLAPMTDFFGFGTEIWASDDPVAALAKLTSAMISES